MTTLDEVLATGRGVERSFNCHKHDDSSASASVNTVKGVWVCYACGASGAAGGGSITESMRAVIAAMTDDATTMARYHERWLDVFDADHTSAFWTARVGRDVAMLFRCGTHPVTGCPTYPIRDPHGRVLGVVQRQPPPLKPKYLYPTGVSVSRCLFGYERARRRSALLLVEGAGDVMAAYAASAHAYAVPLGTYGAGVHRPQVDLIAALNPAVVICAFDTDAAGQAATQRTEAILAQRDIPTVRFTYPAEVKDIGDMTASDIAKEVSRHGRHDRTAVPVA